MGDDDQLCPTNPLVQVGDGPPLRRCGRVRGAALGSASPYGLGLIHSPPLGVAGAPLQDLVR
jgi:hypothetical protein